MIIRKCLIIALCAMSVTACSSRDIRQTIDIINATAEEIPLTEAEVSAALKDALSRGIARGAAIASSENGYLSNPRLKLEFPEDVRDVEKALRKIGLGKDVDRFVRQLNRSAEQAAAKAKPIFIKAITEMTIRDAFGILNGDAGAATRYLRRTTDDDLYDAFLPVVQSALEQSSATRYYADIVESYNKIPFARRIDPDLDRYATEKSIEGLFVLIAEEEARIRANPAARTTQLLRRVFGSLD